MKPSTDHVACSPVCLEISPSAAARGATMSDRIHDRTAGQFEFPTNALWGFDAKPQTRVTCLGGLIWITQTGDGTDHVLAENESFTIALRGRVVIQALSNARVEIA